MSVGVYLHEPQKRHGTEPARLNVGIVTQPCTHLEVFPLISSPPAPKVVETSLRVINAIINAPHKKSPPETGRLTSEGTSAL